MSQVHPTIKNSPTIRRVRETIAELRAALDQELQLIESDFDPGDLGARIAMAERLGLDNRLAYLFQELSCSDPSACASGDALYGCGLDTLSCEQTAEGAEVRFSSHGRNYRMVSRDDGTIQRAEEEIVQQSRLTLTDESCILLEMQTAVEPWYSALLTPVRIIAFAPGPWIGDLIECHEIMCSHRAAHLASS